MEQFQYLKVAVGTTEPDALNFILNVWLVWKGGRNAYLLETANFENPTLFRQALQDFANQYSEILGTVTEGGQAYPRILLYRKGAVSDADVQAVASGVDADPALVRLLQFGCLDSEFGNEELDRTAYELVIQAQEFPREQILTFVCSENVAQPSETYLRQIARPVKAALTSTFQDVHVQWEFRSLHSLSKLVELFGKFARTGDNTVLTDQTRRNFLNVLSADDARGYENLVGFFETNDLAKYQKDVTEFSPAILALLVMRLCDVGDYLGSDPENEGPYLDRIKCAEDWLLNWMPNK